MTQYTIDDHFGDQRPGASGGAPTFAPSGSQWDTPGGTCAGCIANSNLYPAIDVAQAHSGTWQSTTVSPDEVETTISVTFIGALPLAMLRVRECAHAWCVGTSITVYCILPPDLGPFITSYMNLSFVLDGQQVGTFERIANTASW